MLGWLFTSRRNDADGSYTGHPKSFKHTCPTRHMRYIHRHKYSIVPGELVATLIQPRVVTSTAMVVVLMCTRIFLFQCMPNLVFTDHTENSRSQNFSAYIHSSIAPSAISEVYITITQHLDPCHPDGRSYHEP